MDFLNLNFSFSRFSLLLLLFLQLYHEFLKLLSNYILYTQFVFSTIFLLYKFTLSFQFFISKRRRLCNIFDLITFVKFRIYILFSLFTFLFYRYFYQQFYYKISFLVYSKNYLLILLLIIIYKHFSCSNITDNSFSQLSQSIKQLVNLTSMTLDLSE